MDIIFGDLCKDDEAFGVAVKWGEVLADELAGVKLDSLREGGSWQR